MSHSKPAPPKRHSAINLNFCAALKIPSNAADCCPEFGYTEHPRSTGFSHSAYAFAQMTNVYKCYRTKIGEIIWMPCDATCNVKCHLLNVSCCIVALMRTMPRTRLESSPKLICQLRKIITNVVRTMPSEFGRTIMVRTCSYPLWRMSCGPGTCAGGKKKRTFLGTLGAVFDTESFARRNRFASPHPRESVDQQVWPFYNSLPDGLMSFYRFMIYVFYGFSWSFCAPKIFQGHRRFRAQKRFQLNKVYAESFSLRFVKSRFSDSPSPTKFRTCTDCWGYGVAQA